MSVIRDSLESQVRKKLDTYVGRAWYSEKDEKTHKIKSYIVNDDDTVTIITTHGNWRKDFIEVDHFLSRFTPTAITKMEASNEFVLDTPSIAPSERSMAVQLPTRIEEATKSLDSDGNLKTLATGLMEAFEKVKSTPTYVAQAKAQVEVAKTIIDLYKVKVEGLKVMSDLLQSK